MEETNRLAPSARWWLGRYLLPHPARVYTLIVSVAFIAGGIAGLVESPGLNERALFNVITLNGPHSSVHLALGILGLFCYMKGYSLGFARANALLFGILTVAGFLPQPIFGVITLAGSDMFVHGTVAILGEAVSRVEEHRELEADEAVIRAEHPGRLSSA